METNTLPVSSDFPHDFSRIDFRSKNSQKMDYAKVNDLVSAFNEYFSIIPATTPDLKEKIFRLRYEVICEELKMPEYETWRFPDGQEIDEYDERSVHCLIQHRKSGQTVGALRLILVDSKDPQKPFPIEKHVGHLFDKTKFDFLALPRHQIAEVSRFILAKRFRSRADDGSNVFGPDKSLDAPDPCGRRHFPHPVLGLLVALVQMSAEHQITYWYTIMEPKLNRLLRRFSFSPTPIGPIVEYHGLRKPYLGYAPELLDRAYRHHRDIWELLTNNGKIWLPPQSSQENLVRL